MPSFFIYYYTSSNPFKFYKYSLTFYTQWGAVYAAKKIRDKYGVSIYVIDTNNELVCSLCANNTYTLNPDYVYADGIKEMVMAP